MRQKLQKFRKDIRKKQIEKCFKSKRQKIQYSQRQVAVIILNQETQINHNRQSLQSPQKIDAEQTLQTENDIYEQWKFSQEEIDQYLLISQYERILMIMKDVCLTLQKVAVPSHSLHCKISSIYDVFLRTTILGNFIKSVNCAYHENISKGTLQLMSTNTTKIFSNVIQFRPTEFPESLFLQNNILFFLRMAISQGKYDKKHLTNIVTIVTHMIIASTNGQGVLFNKLNNKDNEIFNLTAVFFSIGNQVLKPSDNLTINFMIMIKYYLQRIQGSIDEAKKSGKIQLRIPLNLTKDQLDICFQLSILSVHYFMETDIFHEQEMLINFEECLQVMRILIQLSPIDCKWLKTINYRGLLDLVRMKNCSKEVISKIFIIIDHLIFVDQEDKFVFQFVRGCELIQIMWAVKNDFLGFVLNILSNISTIQKLKQDLSPYIHKIILMLQYESNNYLIYQFVFNWFMTQGFEVKQSRDELFLKILSNDQVREEKISDLESLLWLKLLEANGDIRVPDKILRLDNPNARFIKEQLLNGQDYI